MYQSDALSVEMTPHLPLQGEGNEGHPDEGSTEVFKGGGQYLLSEWVNGFRVHWLWSLKVTMLTPKCEVKVKNITKFRSLEI